MFNTARVREACIAGILLCFTSSLSGAEPPTRPNVLFIFSDDHATQAISAYGGRLKEVAPTPNIDRIAREGVLFQNSFCTNSICAPSRAVILTGKHSHLNGKVDNSVKDVFDGSQQTVPKLLQVAGYETAIIGKWHLRSDPTGFDHWEVLPGQGSYYNPDFRTAGGKQRYTGYVTDIITDLSLDWLKRQRDPSKPFLLMCQHKAPHREWLPGPNHLTTFEDVTIPEPDNLFDDYADRASGAARQEMSIAHHMRPYHDLKVTLPLTDATRLPGQFERMNEAQRRTWDAAYVPRNQAYLEANLQGSERVRWMYQRYMKDYLRCVRAVDDNIGRMLEYLDESGLAERTIVIYSSDQGFYLGEHGWYDKRWMYEESLKMPLVVRWPGQLTPGTMVEEMVQNLDYAPTLLQACGAGAPADMQGESFLALAKGESPGDWRKSIYYHYYEYPVWHRVPSHYGVRTETMKLIFYDQTREWELFDLEADPHEMRSVYDDPHYQPQVERLKTELRKLRDYYQDDTGVDFGSL